MKRATYQDFGLKITASGYMREGTGGINERQSYEVKRTDREEIKGKISFKKVSNLK